MSDLREIILSQFTYNNGKLLWKESRAGVSKGSSAGCKTSTGYYRVKLYGKIYQRSHLIWILHHRLIPDGFIIDHINRDTSDDCIYNLRLVTLQENQFNRDANGCSFYKRLGLWKSYIKAGKISLHLGYYPEEEQARFAYQEAKKKYHVIEERV